VALAPGTRLGPYEILAPLGAGGMGEVYRAKDPRIDRTVALKVLPEKFFEDSERRGRFEREAKLLASLNHPGIAVLYSFEEISGSSLSPASQSTLHILVMELLEGETLRSALAGAKVSTKKALEWARQMAQGLAAAHEKGIVHRDLKPENVFVTKDGRIKILDFGLAKLTQAEESPDVTNLPTATRGTEPGIIMGTLGYMSPEQVKGKPADARSDIFSFGAILYEMLSGQRAFHRETAAETISAILKEDPPDLSVTNQNVPPGLERLVAHCLEKNPEQRFHSAHDLAFDLESLSGSTAPGPPAGEIAKRGRRTRAVLGVVLVVGAALGIAYLVRGSGRGPVVPTVTRLTFRRGQVDAARFAPDGQTVVYSASWNGRPYEVFSTRLGSTEARNLGFPSSVLAGISTSGEMALLGNAIPLNVVPPGSQKGMLASAPLAGGPARDIAEGVQFAEWSPDGKQLAVVRAPAGKTRLEFPIGNVLYETNGWIANPRFSPRGDRIAFLDYVSTAFFASSVTVVDLKGKRTVLALSLTMTNGLAWSPGGDEVWFAGGRDGLAKDVIAVTLSGRERVVFRSLTNLHLYDVGVNGRVLLGQEQRRRELWARTADSAEDRELSWMDTTVPIAISSNGKTLVFNEYGEGGGMDHGVYVRAMDGSAPVRIGSGTAFDLSADGRWVLTIAHFGTAQQRVALLPAGAGQPRELPTESFAYEYGSFSPDGQKVVFGATKAGEERRAYVQDVDGGGPPKEYGHGVAPTPWDSANRAISADGRFVVRDSENRPFLLSLAGGEPRPLQGILPDEGCAGWTDDGRLYVYGGSGPRIRMFRLEPATGRREPWKEIGPADTTGVWPPDTIVVTPDGSTCAYSFARRLTDLFVVEGLK
jgi:tRNA A-37 threonylcarbamoyl transferase component Bud32/dipeptidyl aminopeptidase/acylaminoacyl peptidase